MAGFGMIAIATLSPAQTLAVEPPSFVYRCSAQLVDVGRAGSSLELSVDFAEDGSIRRRIVVWTERSSNLIRPLDAWDSGSIILTWPGGLRSWSPSQPFRWDDGRLRVVDSGPGSDNGRDPGQDEEWRQVIVDRDDPTPPTSSGFRFPFLLPKALDYELSSQLEPLSSRGLDMGLESLLAWGSVSGRVTVYETLVSRRPAWDISSRPSAARRRRIVAQYGIDTAALLELAHEIRMAGEAWTESLDDYCTSCPRAAPEAIVIM